MNSFGRRLRVQLFGESHGEGVGCVLDGVPPGFPVEPAAIAAAMATRRPGQSPLTSARAERDEVRILAGVHAGRTTGAPVGLWIANEDARPHDYAELHGKPRPGHAEWTSHVASHGFHDPRGGGHLSGRLTAPLVAAGAVLEPLLAGHGIACGAHLHQVGDVAGPAYARGVAEMRAVAATPLKTAHRDLEARFRDVVEGARRDRDSVGGVVEFAIEGLPTGLGDPHFDGIEPLLARILFAIPAVKGVDFGAGFASAAMRGSQHNDAYDVVDGRVAPRTNHAGGILGGRTTGAPVRGRVAVKPSSTLPGRPQETVDLATMTPATIEAGGRHDPCVAIRAVPAVTAALQLASADLVLLGYQQGLLEPVDWRSR